MFEISVLIVAICIMISNNLLCTQVGNTSHTNRVRIVLSVFVILIDIPLFMLIIWLAQTHI